MIAATEAGDYKDAALDELEEASVYEGIDRAVYQKGGVALTSDALRKDVNRFFLPFGRSVVLTGKTVSAQVIL